MFGSHVLETAAGLALIYFVLSLFVSTLNEWIAGVLGLRSHDLELALKNLLSEDVSPAPAQGRPATQNGQGMATALLSLPTIQGLSAPSIWGSGVSKPSYIEAKTFSSAVMRLLVPEDGNPSLAAVHAAVAKMTNADLRSAMLPLIDQASGNMDIARANLESWYNQAMDRLSGRYKRRAQMIMFCLGLALAAGLNVDTVRVTSKLWMDPVLRQEIVADAQHVQQNQSANAPRKPDLDAYAYTAGENGRPGNQTSDTAQPRPDASLSSQDSQLGQAARQVSEVYFQEGMPVGWSPDSLKAWSFQNFSGTFWMKVLSLLGWCLTALALSLGAPFWFDFLNETLGWNARLSGAKPVKPTGVSAA